jgi:hypothetical protein
LASPESDSWLHRQGLGIVLIRLVGDAGMSWPAHVEQARFPASVTNLTAAQAHPARLADWTRGRWGIEALHYA